MCFQKFLAASAALVFTLVPSAVSAEVTLIQLANEGIIVSSGDTRVMIDGLVVEPYAIYAGLPVEITADFMRAAGHFRGIDLVLVSHRHHDHNQPEFACKFMKISEKSRLVTSAQVIDLVREKCRDFVVTTDRIEQINPKAGQPLQLSQGEAQVTVIRLSHGKHKYASIDHFAHLVAIGGKRILHIGDAAMDPEVFESAGLENVSLDVALIPIWFFQPGPGEAIVRDYLDADLRIAVQVPPEEVSEARAYLAESYPGVLLLDPLEEIRIGEGANDACPERAAVTSGTGPDCQGDHNDL